MKYSKIISLMAILGAFMLMTGCLTTEEKEYYYKLTDANSGYGMTKYINIVSEEDDGENVSFKDFGELISDYYQGTKLEDENTMFKNVEKKLYEENGTLCGEMNFTFTDFDSLGFYQDQGCDCSSIYLYLGSLSETLIETNGEYLGANRDFPVIKWPGGTTEFYFKTRVKEDMTDAHGLLQLYKVWEESN